MVSKIDPSVTTLNPDVSEMAFIAHRFMVSVCRRDLYIDCQKFEELFCRSYAVFKRVRKQASQTEFGQFMIDFGTHFSAHAEVEHFLTSCIPVSFLVRVNRNPDLTPFFHVPVKKYTDRSKVNHEIRLPIFAIRAGNFVQLAGISQHAVCMSQLMETTATDNTVDAFDVVVVVSSQSKKVSRIWKRIVSGMRWIFQFNSTILLGSALGGLLHYYQSYLPYLPQENRQC